MQANAPLLSEDAQEAVYSVAYTHFRQGQYGEAIVLFRTLTCVNPLSRKFWIALGACFQNTKEYSQALDNYERALMLDPNDPYIHLYAANCFFAKSDAKKGLLALACAEKVLKGQPSEQRRNLKAHIALMKQAWRKNTHA